MGDEGIDIDGFTAAEIINDLEKAVGKAIPVDDIIREAEQKGVAWPLDKDIKVVYDHFMEVMKRNDATAISEKNARGWWPFIER